MVAQSLLPDHVANTLQLQIVTPKQVLFDGEVENFTVPGAVGPFQVLSKHAPIVSALVPGLFKFDVSGREERYFIGGGFLEMHENRATVLAASAEKPTEIDVNRALQAKERAQARVKILDGSMDNERARAALDRANARLAIAGVK
jgi:F-type H+-transporting ATPase subunit epsilon